MIKLYKKFQILISITFIALFNLALPAHAQTNNPPQSPVNFKVYRDTNIGSQVYAGQWIKDHFLTFTAFANDPNNDNCSYSIELQPLDQPFTNSQNASTSYGYAPGQCPNGYTSLWIQNEGQYHIQIRACDDKNACSSWVQYPYGFGFDFTPPVNGSISYPHGIVASGTPVTVRITSLGLDLSGLDTGASAYQQSTRPLINNVCTGSDNFQNVSNNILASIQVTPQADTCYKFRYLSVDAAGNSAVFASANEFHLAQTSQPSSSSSSSISSSSSSSAVSSSSSSIRSSSTSSASSSSQSSSSTSESSTSTADSSSTENTSTSIDSSASSSDSTEQQSSADKKTSGFPIFETSDKIEDLLDKIHISDNEKLNELAKDIFRIGLPTIKISIFPLLLLLLLLLNNLYLLQPGLLISSIVSIFMKRKIEQIGLIYDENSMKPIAFAIVRIFDRNKRTLITQKVSDLRGRYSFLIPPGQYILTAEHSDFKYYETEVEIKALDYSVNLDIGLVKKNYNKFSLMKIVYVFKKLTKQYFNYMINTLFIIGFMVAVASIYLNPGILNYINFFIYICMFGFLGYLYMKSPGKWGYVYDSLSQTKLPRAFVRLFNYHDKKLIDTQITDKYGRYGFIVDPGEYLILINIKGYKFPSRIFPQSHIEKTFYGSLIKVKVEKSQISNFAIPVDRSKDDLDNSGGEMKFASPFS